METKHYLVSGVIPRFETPNVQMALVELEILDYCLSEVRVHINPEISAQRNFDGIIRDTIPGIKLEMIVDSETKKDRVVSMLKEHIPAGIQQELAVHYSEILVPRKEQKEVYLGGNVGG